MKTFAAGLAGAYASGSTSLCVCLRVLRRDGVIATFCSADRDVTIGGEVYLAAVGLGISNLVVGAGLAVDALLKSADANQLANQALKLDARLTEEVTVENLNFVESQIKIA